MEASDEFITTTMHALTARAPGAERYRSEEDIQTLGALCMAGTSDVV